MRRRSSPGPVSRRSRSSTLVLVASAIAVAGCGAESVDGVDGDQAGALAGLTDCGSPDAPVAAFWGSDQGVGFADDSQDAPSGGDIWTMTVDGRVTQLTDDARSRDPSMSDDAKRLYFTRSNGGLDAGVAAPGTQLWVRDLATGDETLIYDTGEDTQGFNEVEESPDGTAIAFSAHLDFPRSSIPRVYVLDLDPLGEPTVVPFPPIDKRYPFQMQASPTWSPDGARLAYVLVENDRSTGWRSSLRVVDLATGDDSLLYRAPDERSYMLSLQWSPDGSALVAAVKGDQPQEGFMAVSIDAATGDRTVLVDAVPDSVTNASADGTAVGSIGLTFEQIEDPTLLQEPVLTTWTGADTGATDALPVHLSFATQLTIADCSLPRPEG